MTIRDGGPMVQCPSVCSNGLQVASKGISMCAEQANTTS